MHIQSVLSGLPSVIPTLPDCILYVIMLAIPILGLGLYFIKTKKWFDILLVSLVPLLTFILNCMIKPLVHRPRPPHELQLSIHPDSFSYVSSHSLVTFCLWGLVVYYAIKFNWKFKPVVILIAILWTLFVGFSRVWLGVHNPTDVIGAYLLGTLIISGIIALRNRL